MIIGRITGTVSTKEFEFLVTANAYKFQYIQVMDKYSKFILAQIIEIEKSSDRTVAYCAVIGYRDEQNILKSLAEPLEPSLEVLEADDNFIQKTLGLNQSRNAAFIGTLDGKDNIKVYLDLNTLLTKHVFITAKSGAGKSFCCGILLEEIIDRKIPVLIIDPHNEYHTLKYPAENNHQLELLGLEVKGYKDQVQEYALDARTIQDARPLRLSKSSLSPDEVLHLLPAKLSNAQLGSFYAAVKNLGNRIDFDDLILELETEESSIKWTLINVIEYVKKLNLFSDSPTLLNELIQPGKASIINLRGVPPEIQEIIVYKLLRDLFEARKTGKVPPFFLVIEEGHNYIPERGYGEAKSSPILRQIFAEGRKFGLGVCLITQRPSRVEKNAISQITTQMILKVTNPHDIKAISSSVEGITAATEKEIQNIPIGTAMVVGVVDTPLFVKIRPRRTKHGGEAVDILGAPETGSIVEDVQESEDTGEMLPVIKQKIEFKDVRLMHSNDIAVKVALIPCLSIGFADGGYDYNILINLNNGNIVTNIEDGTGILVRPVVLDGLSQSQRDIIRIAMPLKEFRVADLFSKCQLQFSELHNLVVSLAEKGYFTKNMDRYKLSPSLNMFADIKQYACYQKIEYMNMDYDEMYAKNVSTDSLLQLLSQFITIGDIRECWLASYVLEHH